eukprot:SAG22_NODE_43_length_25304_cov_5.394644_2_plen_370_part_00
MTLLPSFAPPTCPLANSVILFVGGLLCGPPMMLGHCIDCNGMSTDGSMQAQAYTLLKTLDPYHATVGAMNNPNLWSFSDVPSYLNASAGVLASPVLPTAQQPATQLSLDVLMYENYDEKLAAHNGVGDWDGTAAGVPAAFWPQHNLDGDGRLRNGARWSPIVNCPGADPGNHHWTAPRFLRSDAWLAAVMIGAAAQQGWVFPAWNPSQSPDDKRWPWQEQVQLEIYAAQAALLYPAIAAPFGAVVHPVVLLNASRFPSLRARAWTNVSITAAARSSAPAPPSCGFLVLVNTNESAPVLFQLALTVAPPIAANSSVAVRLFDASYSKPLFDAGGEESGGGGDKILEDWVGPGSTNIYVLGDAACAELICV